MTRSARGGEDGTVAGDYTHGMGHRDGLHHRRNMTLKEDACQMRRGQAPQVLAALNNAVIGIVLNAGEHNLAATQRAFSHTLDRLLARRAAF